MIQKYPIPHYHPWNCQKGEKRDDSGDELLNTDCYATLEKKRTLKMFEYNPEDDVYIANLNSVLKLNLLLQS